MTGAVLQTLIGLLNHYRIRKQKARYFRNGFFKYGGEIEI